MHKLAIESTALLVPCIKSKFQVFIQSLLNSCTSLTDKTNTLLAYQAVRKKKNYYITEALLTQNCIGRDCSLAFEFLSSSSDTKATL